MPGQMVENLLWLYTEPGQIVMGPFAGGGTTIDVSEATISGWFKERKLAESESALPFLENYRS